MKSSTGKVTAPRPGRLLDSPGVRVFKALFWWVCVPALIAFVGYRFVGPSIGKVPEIKRGAEKILATGPSDATTYDGADSVSEGSKPTIDISVEKGSGTVDRPADTKPKRTKKKKAKPADPKPSEDSSPMRDPASGDGATAPTDGDPASGGGEGTGGFDGPVAVQPVA